MLSEIAIGPHTNAAIKVKNGRNICIVRCFYSPQNHAGVAVIFSQLWRFVYLTSTLERTRCGAPQAQIKVLALAIGVWVAVSWPFPFLRKSRGKSTPPPPLTTPLLVQKIPVTSRVTIGTFCFFSLLRQQCHAYILEPTFLSYRKKRRLMCGFAVWPCLVSFFPAGWCGRPLLVFDSHGGLP